jgi:hypothetical protein
MVRAARGAAGNEGGAVKYILLIHDDEAAWGAMAEEERNQLFKEYMEFGNELQQRGALRAGDQLQPTSTATTVRVKDGKTLTTDGPFAETKEQLGGYYIIETENLDQAIQAAAMVPSTRVGGVIEVRPLVEFEEQPQ